jgi:alginate O-acetyltransferase complex protein AlgI
MLFSSLIFIFGFLPAFLVLYYLTPKKYRNYTALAASYFFYAWGAPIFVFVLLSASLFDYYLSKKIAADRTSRKQKKQLLAFSLAANIGLLAYFKYANFFVGEFNDLLGVLGLSGFHWTHIALPLGISFFTFQKITYLVDVYRETTQPAKNFFHYALYVALFPQLIAGPIVRYHDISDQIRQRVHSVELFFEGLFRFSIGLGKKVLIANSVGEIADQVFALHSNELTAGFAWLGILAYAFQIYFDFSGYSDMAIGLGKMMGFTFLENFRRPYIAVHFTDFWRRWHISLSNFMKEYLYIPLGGNRVPKRRMYFNLWTVFLLSGLWHGASWNFVVWGAYHGLFLVFDKMFWIRISKKLPTYLNIGLTFFWVTIGWVFFRSETLGEAVVFLKHMFAFGIGQIEHTVLFANLASNRAVFMLFAAALISFFPVREAWAARSRQSGSVGYVALKCMIILLLFVLSSISLANASFNPFIYFRF